MSLLSLLILVASIDKSLSNEKDMQTNSGKICVFCSVPITRLNRSKEHVIPQWLLDFLKLGKESIQPTHYKPTGEVVSTRKHTVEGLLEGAICTDCNTGWMSSLENKAMPILQPLILGDRAVVELNDSERHILGIWTTKTAYCLNSSSNYIKNIPHQHMEFIREYPHKLPDRVMTFAQQHHGQRVFYWMQAPLWRLHGTEAELQQQRLLLENSYKVTFQFGKLLLLVCYIPPSNNIFPVIWKGIHVPLLPTRGKCSWYENEDFNWGDSEKAFNAFHWGLEITSNSELN